MRAFSFSYKRIPLLYSFVCIGLMMTHCESSEPIRFNRDIRPLLSQNCFQCHGPDAKNRKADLRLDTEEGIQAAFGGGLEQSEGWQRIMSTDPDLKMPPADAHKELKANDVEILRTWINAGSAWQGHWAFISPTKPSLPQVNSPDQITTPIDAFVLHRLEQDHRSFSPPADRERLLRRVTFDLTGLPPTIAEIDAFLADESSNAYEKAVDRLLASRHYGERMAVAWLDAARYGDTSVFHADGPRDMWPWRDWVINAFNDNKPYDQFTVEQLAGDLLPNATVSQKIATGFNRNNATTDEGGAIDEEFRVEYAVDRVKTTSLVWLGLTMECAQCHDHKYDPISQQDYYRFFAYFNQSADPGMQTRGGNQSPIENIYDERSLLKAEELKRQLVPLESQLVQRSQDALPQFEAWAQEAAIAASKQPLLPSDLLVRIPLDEQSGENVAVLSGNSPLTGKTSGKVNWIHGTYIDAGQVGSFERTDQFSYGAWIKPEGGGNGAPIARMDDANAHRGYDIYVSGNRVSVHIINHWPDNALKVVSKEAIAADAWSHVFVTYDGSSKASGIGLYFNGKKQEWTASNDQLTETIVNDKPFYVGRRNPGSTFTGSVDDVQIYSRALTETEVAAVAGADPIAPILVKSPETRSESERNALLAYYLNSRDESYKQISKSIADLKTEIANAEKPISTVMVMKDLPAPRMTYVLDRGNYQSPKQDQPLQPGVPAALPALPSDAPPTRLGLAQWIVRPDHPLTSRVAVNRFWEMFMGNGLVQSVEDFGAQGEMPSNEMLLDWLATDFVENGWDVKRFIKQLVMSTTYRQSSRVTPSLLEYDPENRLLARGPRFRLQGEFVRDNALAASGLLVPTIGGPSVKPYQPPGLWEEVSIGGDQFVQDHGDKLYRRSIYTYLKRSAPPPTMQIFDAPTREKCVLRRSRTNTPLQALVTMNDPQFVEAARNLAERAIKQTSSLDEQLMFAYRTVTGQRPSQLALDSLKQSFENEQSVFQANAERATKLLSIGESARDSAIDAAQHAAMTVVCSIILNLDITLTRS
jgi:Protein of unknown function (DUF1553)/Protein of unknown function (DUF1549)/Concanavalin A-like lectin/glucanases superfamily/Planctomycete cytochrome C